MDAQFLKRPLAVFMAGAILDVSYFLKDEAVSYLFYIQNLYSFLISLAFALCSLTMYSLHHSSDQLWWYIASSTSLYHGEWEMQSASSRQGDSKWVWIMCWGWEDWLRTMWGKREVLE
jgi:hypothetical protein